MGPAPRPPYSVGHATPTQRPPASLACHSRPNATSSARSSKRGGSPRPYSHGRLARSHASNSARTSVATADHDYRRMDFELSADQLALRDAARDLLDRLAAPERVRKIV